MVIIGKAGAYASTYFLQAHAKGGPKTVSTFEKELNVLTWSVRGDTKWEVETQSPFFDLEHKQNAVRTKCKELGLSPFFAERIVELLRGEDVGRLEQIRTDYEEIMRAFRKERDVTLVTKQPLSPQEAEFYRKTIRASYLTPEDVMVFQHQVDETILAGMKVIIDKVEYDLTWNNPREKWQEQGQARLRAAAQEAKSHMRRPEQFKKEEFLKNIDFTIFPKDAFAKQMQKLETLDF